MSEHKPIETIYDVGIIGGGIAGCAIARDAAMRGLSVVLFEKGTIGSGTSSKSSKLIHGGIRYLETAWNAFKRGDLVGFGTNLRFVFLSLKEARTLECIAPDLVKPIPIIIPVYADDVRGLGMISFGAHLYYLLSRITGPAYAPNKLNIKEVLEELPGLKSQGLTGGIRIWDRTTDDLGLVRATLDSARRYGAAVHEHTVITGYAPTAAGRQFSVQGEHKGLKRQFRVRQLVNASGPWLDQIRLLGGEFDREWLEPVAGSHIEFKKFLKTSVLLQSQDQRFFFIINTPDRSRVGTTERLHSNPDTVSVTKEEITYLLKALQNYFPGQTLTESDILSRDAGVRPLTYSNHKLKKTELSRDHRIAVSPSGMISVIGVKLTDHRRAAARVTDLVVRHLSGSPSTIKRKSETAVIKLSQHD